MNQMVFEEVDVISQGNEMIKALIQEEINDIVAAHEGKSPEALAEALENFFIEMKAYLSEE